MRQKKLLLSSSRETLPIYQNNGLRHKTNRSAATGAARLDISGRTSLAISVLALNYDEVSQVGSISRATNRKKTHRTCLCSVWKRIHGSPLFTRHPVHPRMLVGSPGSVSSADVIFREIQEYKPQPQRINYVSSVIRLMLVYTESESRCLRSIFALLRNDDRFAI